MFKSAKGPILVGEMYYLLVSASPFPSPGEGLFYLSLKKYFLLTSKKTCQSLQGWHKIVSL